MTFVLSALGAALGQMTGYDAQSAFAARYCRALSLAIGEGADPSAQISFAQAGTLMCLAFRPDTADLDLTVSPPLVAAEISLGDRCISIEPSNAMAHPLLRDWIAADLAGSFANFFRGEADLSALGASWPTRCKWELTDVSGRFCARFIVTLQSGVSAALDYGEAPSPRGCFSTRIVMGDALCSAVGAALALSAPAQAGSLLEVAQVALATVEAEAATVQVH